MATFGLWTSVSTLTHWTLIFLSGRMLVQSRMTLKQQNQKPILL
jgi:hypothetical protein